jgi:hypothetical protein
VFNVRKTFHEFFKSHRPKFSRYNELLCFKFGFRRKWNDQTFAARQVAEQLRGICHRCRGETYARILLASQEQTTQPLS